jgi:hypothetical protein
MILSLALLLTQTILSASTFPGADQCAQLQAAIDAAVAAGGGQVEADFGPGTYTCASGFVVKPGVHVYLLAGQRYVVEGQVWVQQNAHLLGFGTAPMGIAGATVIQAANGLNNDVLLVENSAGPTVGVMWAEVGWIRIEGNGANQTAGNCLAVNQLDDTNSIHDIMLKSCWGWGIHFTGLNSGASTLDDISIFSSLHGGALFFDGTESGLFFGRVHAAGNVGPAVYCKSTSGATTLTFGSFQLEGSNITGAGTPAIVNDGTTSNCRMHFIAFSASSVVGGTDFIRHLAVGVSTSTPTVIFDDVNLSNDTQYPTFYRDLHNNYSVPISTLTPNGHAVQVAIYPWLAPYSTLKIN